MRILVVGAGIAGLSAAHALAAGGHQVTIIERSASLQSAGAGIILAPNAVHCLEALGVDVTPHGWELDRLVVRTPDGLTIAHGTPTPEFGPPYAIARPQLQALLAADLPGSVDLLFGAALTALVEEGGDITAHWHGGVGAFDLVVGADGVNSPTRQQIAGPQSLRYSGYTCWRGLASLDAGRTAVEIWGSAPSGGAVRAGIAPVGADTAYYYLVADARAGDPGPDSLPALRDRFGRLGEPVTDLLAGLSELPPLHHDLYEVARVHWGRGRILLVGDAAHAMTPNLGQGAGMAIEDALGLALALDEGPDGALERYEAERARRVNGIRLASRRVGQLGHLPTRGLRRVAQRAMAAVGPRVEAAQYRSLVAPGVTLAQTWRSA